MNSRSAAEPVRKRQAGIGPAYLLYGRFHPNNYKTNGIEIEKFDGKGKGRKCCNSICICDKAYEIKALRNSAKLGTVGKPPAQKKQ